MAEKNTSPFFTARRCADGDNAYFEIAHIDAQNSSEVIRAPNSSMESLLEFCRTKLSMRQPQCRSSDGSPIASESHFGEFDAFHIVDAYLPPGTEALESSTTSSENVFRFGPAPYPILGNIPHIARSFSLQTDEMLKHYGPVVLLHIFGAKFHVTNDALVVKKIFDNPEMFPKVVIEGPLMHLRRLAGDGLFTATEGEENWGIAHRILMPAFGRASIQKYAPEISRSARKFIDNLNKFYGSERDIPLLNWTTKMTFDAIATCGFAYNFNSLDVEEEAPAITWMVDILNEALARTQRGSIGNWVNIWAERRYSQNIKNFHNLVEEIHDKRRHESESERSKRQDLLSLMLNSTDAETGKRLSDLNMIYQCVTFLIAGHETTSTLLSWACYLISQNPAVEQKLIQEIDSVLDADPSVPPTMEQIGRLKFTEMIIKEVLRLYPPVPGVGKLLKEQNEFEYRDPQNPSEIKTGLTEPSANRVIINIYSLHRNKIYWGDDADKFVPERWTPEAVSARSQKNGAANAFTWLPFSFGSRACIGMQFALLEAKIVLSMLFRQYVFRLSPNSKVTMQTTPSLTLRPENLLMRMHARIPRSSTGFPSSIPVPSPASSSTASVAPESTKIPSVEAKLNLLVLFGSNTGTCEDVGLKLSHTVETAFRGSKIVAFKPLNQGIELLQKHNGPDDAVLVITATYNGQPPDNANHFNRWLDETKKKPDASLALKGVKFTVVGVGNSQWVTFQSFPRKVDNSLEALGAERYMGRGELDMDSSSWEDALIKFRVGWIAQLLHTFVGDKVDAADILRASASLPIPPSAYSVAMVDGPAQSHPIAPGAQNWKILSRKELQNRDSERRTVHIELELPQGVTYGAGDHLGVCPKNSSLLVQALATRLGVKLNQSVVLTAVRAQSSAGVSLPVGTPVSIKDILTFYVDITSSPTMSALALLADTASDAAQKAALERLAGSDPDEYKKKVTNQWKTILELLLEFPSVNLTFERFLDAVPRMQPRFYSISSSPLENSKSLTITVGVAQSVSPAGRVVDGVCSTFLGGVDPALDTVTAYVRDLNNKATPFHLPKSTATPIIMIGAGTGLAPFRGFLQERRALKRSGSQLGRAILFFGCRHQSEDYLYGDELEAFKADGTLSDLFVAFSRKSATQKVYCQDILLSHGEDIWHLVSEQGARIYVCGSAGGLAKGVRAALHKIAVQYGNRSSDLADRWIAALEETGAYVQDVWG